FFVLFLGGASAAAFHLQRADRIRNVNALTFQFVPNIRAHGVVDLIDPSVVAHVELDLIGDGVIGKIDQENFDGRIGQDTVGRLGGASERVFHAIGRSVVIDPDANTHGVDLGRVMEIDDGGPNDLVVRNIEINVVVRAQAGGSPVDLHHFGESISHLQPVAHFVRPVDLDRHAGNDSAEEILP